ncbi:MAG: fimbrillin family protein [Bacteroides sp.]|uniref:fimbrillin family protein n=1 Tax=Bacteroides sp. TaxID=29523 RepID=UPI002FC8FA5F
MKKMLYTILYTTILVSCSKEFTNETTGIKAGEQTIVSFGSSLISEAWNRTAIQTSETHATRSQENFTTIYKGRIGIIQSDEWLRYPLNYSDITINIAANGTTTTNPTSAKLTTGEEYTFRSIAVPGDRQLPTPIYDLYPLSFCKTTDGMDMIYATVTKRIDNGEEIEFAYNHLYGKIAFILTPGEDMTAQKLESATITLSGYYSSGTLDLKTGQIEGNTIGTNVTVDQDSIYYAIPQNFDLSTLPIAKVTVDGRTLIGKITRGNVTSNKLTTITIKVSDRPESSIYVGMFGGKLTENPITGEWAFTNPLYTQTVNQSDNCIWSGNYDATNLTNFYDGKSNTWELAHIGTANSNTATSLCFKKNKGYEHFLSINDANYHWYLPAQSQLMSIWVTHASNPCQLDGSFYWSSSENKGSFAYLFDFYEGDNMSTPKYNTFPLRCVKESF